MEVELFKKLKDVILLVIEDEKSLQDAICSSMGLWCKEVYAASDGESGIDLFMKKQPDVVLTDIYLPKLNGIGVAKKIREISDSVPIIIMTAFDTPENIEGALDVGGYTLLKKPVDIYNIAINVLMSSQKVKGKLNIDLGRGYILDVSKRAILYQDKVFHLTKKEFEILSLLASKKRNTVTYQIIEQSVWKGSDMSGASLRVHINKIREKTYKDLIVSVSGIGYRLEPKEE